MKNLLSFISALVIGLLCVAPTLDYSIPMMVNSMFWLYLVIASGLIAFFIIFQSKGINPILKGILTYLFIGCFFSEVPYFSFNAYLLVVATVCFFLLLKECDFEILINMAQAVFWMELFIAFIRLAGMETLMNFGRPEPIFFGTIFQHMRFASLLCILSPFLLIKTRWYIIPILVAVVMTTSAGFALSIATGAVVYLLLSHKGTRALIYIGVVALAVAGFVIFVNNDSFKVAIREGRLPIWWVCLKTWVLDTRGPMGSPDIFGISQTGPFSWKTFLFGHGLDTFYNIFPAYKHDPSPFPQAHNSWIQLAWETGIVGFSFMAGYFGYLIKKLYDLRDFLMIAGLTIIGVNLFFHMPDRMTQTILLIVCFFSYCEKVIEWGFVRDDKTGR